MKKHLSDHWIFFREFRRTFHTTGAVTPSGRRLAHALTEPLRNRTRPWRILEVGAGTGAITRSIVRQIRSGDQFDLVELNDRFVDVLRRRFDSEPSFRRVAERTQIFHASLEELPKTEPYDLIISGLPMNNFTAGSVKGIFRKFDALLAPDGRLCYYEYLWIRQVKSLVTTEKERRRVAAVGRVLDRYLQQYEFRRRTIFTNLPPALVHHLRFTSADRAAG